MGTSAILIPKNVEQNEFMFHFLKSSALSLEDLRTLQKGRFKRRSNRKGKKSMVKLDYAKRVNQLIQSGILSSDKVWHKVIDKDRFYFSIRLPATKFFREIDVVASSLDDYLQGKVKEDGWYGPIVFNNKKHFVWS
ncbi:MAG: hypothetical protein AAFV53_38915, partial [Myxococcota bacterium]